MSANISLRSLTKIRLSPRTYDKLMTDQSGLCAICGKTPVGRKLAVDHSHTTGQLRGLLCTRCNLGIGYFGDDINRLYRAVDYLLRPPKYGEVL